MEHACCICGNSFAWKVGSLLQKMLWTNRLESIPLLYKLFFRCTAIFCKCSVASTCTRTERPFESSKQRLCTPNSIRLYQKAVRTEYSAAVNFSSIDTNLIKIDHKEIFWYSLRWIRVAADESTARGRLSFLLLKGTEICSTSPTRDLCNFFKREN